MLQDSPLDRLPKDSQCAKPLTDFEAVGSTRSGVVSDLLHRHVLNYSIFCRYVLFRA